uniref:Uncharacterized protein n=1 Tax=Percolomonas cosmopolitus TaxID=63605 RepID=A0A7S1KV08_9EUKA
MSQLSGSDFSQPPRSSPHSPSRQVSASSQQQNVFERLSADGTKSTVSNSSNYFNTLNPRRTETDTRQNRHVAPHNIIPKDVHDEYFDSFVKPKRLRMSRKLSDAPFSRLFTENSLRHIFRWLKLECSPNEKQRFNDLMTAINNYQAPKQQLIMRYSVDESFNLVSLYATGVFTDVEALRVAAWLRNAATVEQKNEFKSLMGAFKAYQKLQFGLLSTQAEEFPVIPTYIPDKQESKSINDVAIRKHRDKYRPIQGNDEREKRIQSMIGRKMNYKSSYQDTFAGRPQSSWSISKKPADGKVPYGVLTGSSMKSTNRAHFQYWGKTQREAPARNENKVTASIGNTIPSMAETVDVETLNRISEENDIAIKDAQTKKSALQGSISTNLNIYMSENKRSFVTQKMYRESDKKAYDNARNQQRKVPFAQSITGYSLGLQSQTHDTFQAKREPWMDKVQETNYNRKKLPSYMNPAV